MDYTLKKESLKILADKYINVFGVVRFNTGVTYFHDGCVSNYTDKKGVIKANVEGMDIYSVEIKMKNNVPTEMGCNCPDSDNGRFCKHMAAVLCQYYVVKNISDAELEKLPMLKKFDIKKKSPDYCGMLKKIYDKFVKQYDLDGYVSFVDIHKKERFSKVPLISGLSAGKKIGFIGGSIDCYDLYCLPVVISENADLELMSETIDRLQHDEIKSGVKDIESAFIKLPENIQTAIALVNISGVRFLKSYLSKHIIEAAEAAAEYDLMPLMLNVRMAMPKKDADAITEKIIGICSEKGAENCSEIMKATAPDNAGNVLLRSMTYRTAKNGLVMYTNGAVQELKCKGSDITATVKEVKEFNVSFSYDGEYFSDMKCNCPYYSEKYQCYHIGAAAFKYIMKTSADKYVPKPVKTTKKKAQTKKAEPAEKAPVTVPDDKELSALGITLDNTTLVSCKPAKKLKEAVIPEGITDIKEGAFQEAKIAKLVLPSTLVSIPDRCFYKCEGIGEIIINDGTESAGDGAFSFCKGLKSITIGNGVKTLGKNAFDGCAKLGVINVGASLGTLNKNIIGECKKLTDINVSPNNKKLASFCGTLFDKKLTKPSYVPYYKSDLCLPPTLKNFTVNCITGKIKELTFDLRGRDNADFCKDQLEGKQDYAIRSINTIYIITDKKEYCLEISGYKNSIAYPQFMNIYPDKNTVKNLVEMIVNYITHGETHFEPIEIFNSGYMENRFSYWFDLDLFFRIAVIVSELYGEDLIKLGKGIVSEAEKLFADSDNEDAISTRFEAYDVISEYPQLLPCILDCDTLAKNCIELFGKNEEQIRGKVTVEQLDKLINISTETDAADATAVFLRLKYELAGGANESDIASEIQSKFEL